MPDRHGLTRQLVRTRGAVLPARAVFLGGPGLRWTTRRPGPELAPWVEVFWRLECAVSQPLRVLPDGCMDIIGEDLVGTLTDPLIANLDEGDVSVGVRFRPGAFTALSGIPASEFVGQHVPLAEVVRSRSLAAMAAVAPEPDWVASLALHAPSVRWLSRETGYSERQLRRRVLAATGHTPKRLGRIGRMQDMLAAGRGESWTRTAVEFGYHDESHMIGDVRALAGASPHEMLDGRFLQGGGPADRHA